MLDKYIMWGFFDRIICLSSDTHEYALASAEFTRVGITATRYPAVREIGPHQSFSHSERNILLDFLYSDDETLLHLEDDVAFRDLGHLPQAISELPADWDILYLGANVTDEQPERVSEHLCRIRSAWTTHAIAYNKKVIRFLLENQPGFSQNMYDNFLGSVLPHLNAFVVTPMVAYQRPRVSSIWGRYDDYTPLFEDCDKRLKASVIYRITSPSGKIYIGQTRNFSHRMSVYRTLKCKAQRKLYNSLVKYGFDNHRVDILHRLSFHASQETIDMYERDAMRVHAGVDRRRLLNCITAGGGNAGGWKIRTPVKRPDVQGQRHKLSKLTDGDVIGIRGFYRKGVRGRGIRQVARRWSISMRLAFNIVKGKTWRHI